MTRAHVPTPATRAVVQSLSQFGVPRDLIAAHVTALVAPETGCSEPTLRKHYAVELSAGKLAANSNVLKFLFSAASGEALNNPKSKASFRDCVSAAMFWAKTQCGFKETIDVNAQHSYVDGARERLAGKLGGSVPAPREEETSPLDRPIGSA
jgi:hypothetical protein